MTKNEILNLLKAYYSTSMLKFSECKNKNSVPENRYESIAEHLYGSQQWAWLLWSEGLWYQKVDIFKVIEMLSLSEMSKVSNVILLGDWLKRVKMVSLMNEFFEETTSEAQFAHFCKKLNDGNESIFELTDNTSVEQMSYLTNIYYLLNTLKSKIRQGIINWNITGIRRESIAEHSANVQQLAWWMWLVSKEEIDIRRVIAMLSFHETEETIIGDITPFCGITPEEKLRMGHEAVEKLLGKLKQFDMMYSLIKEFDAEVTPDAFFAHLCDKLDCDLAVKYYSDGGYCSIANATEKMKNNPKIKKMIADGGSTVADMFIMADEHMYMGTIFEEVINFVKTCDVTKL